MFPVAGKLLGHAAVHEAMLEDIILPAEIVYLHPKEQNNTDYKLETFSTVYRKLAGKDVVFELPGTCIKLNVQLGKQL
ncbi:hypothetical protein GOBAR_DD18799 [Gossypium barbadense]|nr:hypothetical protein GOBAR_DD18799 [Gossypium barbadense]